MTTYDFNECAETDFTEVYYALRKVKTRYVVVYGGTGSSKSYSVHQNELLEIAGEGIGDTLVVRKVAASLRESCYKLFRMLIDKFEMGEEFKCAYSGDNKHITCLANGRKLVFKGIDDPGKLKSIVAFKRVLIEEANELEFEDFLELNRRVRGMKDIQLILILNPVSENHWIKTQLCDAGGPFNTDTTALRFTYHDNRNLKGESFLTEEDVKNIERHKELGENHYRVFVQAEWGVENKDNKFCYAFNRDQEVPTEYDDARILWATFDFNVDPLSCILAQVFAEARTIRAIACIKLPNSDIWKMCDRLKALYPDAMWNVTGDATGTQRSAMSRDNQNYYQIIMDKLELNRQQLIVPSSNPPIEENRVLLNALHNNWTVEIDPVRCRPLIEDLTYVAVTAVGKIEKGRGSARKYADFLDAWRYLANVVNAQTRGGIMR